MNRQSTLAPLVIGVAGLFAISGLWAACGGKSDDGQKKAQVKAQKIHPEAERKWTTLCVNCHAEDGSGKGEGSKTLNPKPRDFRSAEWQKSVTDDHIKKVILKGGLAMKMSKDMPASPELVAKPMVVKGLIAKIRSFEGKK